MCVLYVYVCMRVCIVCVYEYSVNVCVNMCVCLYMYMCVFVCVYEKCMCTHSRIHILTCKSSTPIAHSPGETACRPRQSPIHTCMSCAVVCFCV